MRLTKRDKYGNAYFPCENCDRYDDCCTGGALVDCTMALAERLAMYEDAEEQGRLVILPCKVGDTVYVVKNVVSRGYPDPIITKQIFEEKFRYEHLNFPKAVYLTYEEAEAALKEENIL